MTEDRYIPWWTMPESGHPQALPKREPLPLALKEIEPEAPAVEPEPVVVVAAPAIPEPPIAPVIPAPPAPVMFNPEEPPHASAEAAQA